jgi:ferritin-like metal-binding protein YciE
LVGADEASVHDASAGQFASKQQGGRNLMPRARLQRHSRPLEAYMAAKEKTLEDLFHDTLKDIYFAEKKILTALPKMAKAAHSDELKAAFEKHHAETEGQIERLEQVFELIEKPARGKTCQAILGIVEEGQEIMKEFKESDAHDAGLLAGAQAVEHYEISRYGTLIAWADQLGMRDAARLLKQNLDEEKKTDASLSKLAESSLNQMAA